jgi:hypothetical protein
MDLEPCFSILHEMDSTLSDWKVAVCNATELQGDADFRLNQANVKRLNTIVSAVVNWKLIREALILAANIYELKPRSPQDSDLEALAASAELWRKSHMSETVWKHWKMMKWDEYFAK